MSGLRPVFGPWCVWGGRGAQSQGRPLGGHTHGMAFLSFCVCGLGVGQWWLVRLEHLVPPTPVHEIE